MIARPRPEPDDTPGPELVTPTRLARELVAIATAASRLRIRARGLAVYLAPRRDEPYPTALDHLAALAEELAYAGDRATDLATAIRVGQVTLDERYLDPSCRPERPLLDLVEHAPTRRAAEQIAPVVAAAARGDTDPGWSNPLAMTAAERDYFGVQPPPDGTLDIGAGEPLRVPYEHPQAEPARKAARRRKTGTNGRKGGGP